MQSEYACHHSRSVIMIRADLQLNTQDSVMCDMHNTNLSTQIHSNITVQTIYMSSFDLRVASNELSISLIIHSYPGLQSGLGTI